MSKRRKKKRSSKTKRWGIIFGIELVLILILIPVVFVYAKLSLIQTASASDVDKANIVINNDVDATTQKALKGYRNIALFGVDRSRTNTGGYSQQRNSYSSYYANANQSRPPQNNYRPNRLDWQNITFDSYADANDVLNEMGHALHEYGQVTIADFYDVVGITRDARDYQDCKYGWYDLGPASIKGVPGGYTIVFPKPVPLN